MQKLSENLYQFTTYIPPMDFTIHHYLLASDPAVVFATGTSDMAEKNLPEIKKILDGRAVQYIFVSHLESDECGGLSAFLREYPSAVVLCSCLCARELPGYGYSGKIRPCREGEILRDGSLRLQFFDYPSEIHLQNGLLCFEETHGIFYSADLFLRHGDGAGKLLSGRWEAAVADISEDRVPNEKLLHALQERLLTIAPRLAAVGHGFCMQFHLEASVPL